MVDYFVDDVPDELCRTESSGAWDGSASLALMRPSLSGITPRSGGSVQVSGSNYIFSFDVYDAGTATFSTNTVTIPSIGPAYGAGTPPDLCRIVDLSSVGLGTRAVIWHAGTIGIYLVTPGWATNNGMRRIALMQNTDPTILEYATIYIPDSGADDDGEIVPYAPTAYALNIWGAPLWGRVSGSLPISALSGTLKVYRIRYVGGVATRSLRASYSMSITDPTTWTQVIVSPSWLSAGDYYDEIICEQTTHYASGPDDVGSATISWSDPTPAPYPYTISPWVEAGYGDAYQGSIPDQLLTFSAPECLDLPKVEIKPYDYGPRPPFYPPLLPWPPISPPPNVLTVTVPAHPTLFGRVRTTAEGADPFAEVVVRIEIYSPLVQAQIAGDTYNMGGTTGTAVVKQYLGLGSGPVNVIAYYVFAMGGDCVGYYGRDVVTNIDLP